MDFEAHRKAMLEHCLWMIPLDPQYARWAMRQYSKSPNLQGLEQEVEAEWRRRNPRKPSS